MERSETRGETTSHQIEWGTAVASVLGNRVTSPDQKGTELAFVDLGEGDLKST